jgi:hypothetical protein
MRVDKFKISIYSIFILLSFSCVKSEEKRTLKNYTVYNFSSYAQIHQAIRDTLDSYIKDSLETSKYLHYQRDFIIDSLIIFNTDSTRLLTCLIKRDTGHKHAIFDYIENIGGAKINGKWYFFFGLSTVIDRATYQDSIYSPLTFDELSYLARVNFSDAFYQDENGDVKTRESFFGFMDDPNGWGLPPGSKRKDIDSVIVARNKEMHTRKIDPKEIEQIKADMANSVRPKEPIPDIKWYEKIFPKKKKLFETDEWKEYSEHE